MKKPQRLPQNPPASRPSVIPSDPPCCADCPYWQGTQWANKGGTRVGYCRRFPPAVVVGDMAREVTPAGPVPAFPVTLAGELCGEHPRHPARVPLPRSGEKT